MKKFIFIFAALFLGLSQTNAQEIYVDNFTAPAGGYQTFDVKYKTGGKTIVGYIFKFELPEGLSLVTESDKAIYSYGSGNSDFDVKTTATGVQASPSSKTSQLSGEEGTLLTLTLKVSNPLKAGDTREVKVYDASLTSKVTNSDGTASYFDNDTDPFNFTVTINNQWVLDEASAALPQASGGEVDVLVKRTIAANQWSTICLPFDMWADQVETVFGADSQFATFTGYTKDGSTPSNKQTFTAESIKLNFTTHDWSETASDGIFANTPYLVKVSKDIDEFVVEGVEINPSENVDVQVKQNGTTGRVCGHFYGTECAGKIIPEYGLFLSGNNFHYSKGKTKIKGFRGYFVLNDILADLASPGVKIYVDGDATSIDGIGFQQNIDGVYDLSGRKIKIEGNDLNKLQKGVYIIDGKKVTIK